MQIDGKKLIKIENSEINGHFKIPTNVTEIGNFAFDRCTDLTSLTLNQNLTRIGNYTFYGCTGLTSLTLNEGLTQIGNAAFRGCTGLTSLILNQSLTQIGNHAFNGCTGLKKIIIDTEDETHLNRIKNLLPEGLRGICIKKSIYEKLERIKAAQLATLLAEPATNPLKRFLEHIAPFPHDIWQLLDTYCVDNYPFYQDAKHHLDALPWPLGNDDDDVLSNYKINCEVICIKCIEDAKIHIYKDHPKAGFFTYKENSERSIEEQESNTKKQKR